MPLPEPKGEPKEDFITSCMGDSTMVSEYPNEKQRFAVCSNQYKAKDHKVQDIIHAISSIIDGDDLPEDIQYLPPGVHNITATKNGKPAELTVDVSSETAQ